MERGFVMRIVNYDEFCKLPEGTVFKIVPKLPTIMCNDELCVKGRQTFIMDRQSLCFTYQIGHESIKLSDGTNEFDYYVEAYTNPKSNFEMIPCFVDIPFFDYQYNLDTLRFIIYEKQDIQNIINVLQESINQI